MPTMPLIDDGQTIEPSVSVPTATAAQVRRHRDARARARAARAPVRVVRVHALAAAGAPPTARTRRAEVRPLGQVRLAEDHRARLSQPPDQERIARRRHLPERERPRRRLHAIGGIDVVLHEHGDPMQRPPDAARTALRVERVGDLERVGVRLQHRAERRVGRLDPFEVRLGQPAGGERARRHRGPELLDRRLLELERRVAGHGRTLSHATEGREPQRTAGSFITETIFNLPVIGQYAVTPIFRNDFPSVMGSRSSVRSSSRSRTCASTSRTPTSTPACGSRRARPLRPYGRHPARSPRADRRRSRCRARSARCPSPRPRRSRS